MMKIFSLLFVAFFLLLINFFSPSGSIHAYTKYKVSSVEIGDMHTWDTQYGYPFLVRGRSGTVEFYDKNGKVANNEVQFRPGGAAWSPYTFNASYVADGDLSNNGLTPVCDVGSTVL